MAGLSHSNTRLAKWRRHVAICGWHRIGQPDQVHSLRLDRRLEQQRYQFDARRVHRFSKMLLYDLKKFANFASALGISSFLHRKIGTLQSY